MLHNRATALKSLGIGEAVEPSWPAPDMSILDAGRRSPPVMPPDLFGNVWPVLAEIADGTSSPVDYAALGFLTCAASLIGNKRWVRPFNTTDWREPAIIWAAVVGDPSSNKTPPLLALTRPVDEMERERVADYEEALRLHRATAERAKAEMKAWEANVEAAQKDGIATPAIPDAAIAPDEPQRKRLMVKDTTPEQLLEILSGNPQGVLSYRDELVGWFTSFDRYAPGGRVQWLEAFVGNSHTSDRKGSGGKCTYAPFNGVSVLGGIQPDRLASVMLSGDDDGLAARFLWAWPNPVPFNRPKRLANIGAISSIYRNLEQLPWGTGFDGRDVPITLDLEDGAADLFTDWAKSNGEGLEDAGSLFRGFVGKLRGYVLRLALVAELVRWAESGGEEPRTVSAESLAAAIEWVEDYAKPAALRVFGDAALPPVERNAATLARYILKHKLKRFNSRKLVRTCGLPGFKAPGVMGDAITHLIDADWLVPDGQREGDTIGRKTSDFIVNPNVFGGQNG